jgi:hypothetical protein
MQKDDIIISLLQKWEEKFKNCLNGQHTLSLVFVCAQNIKYMPLVIVNINYYHVNIMQTLNHYFL